MKSKLISALLFVSTFMFAQTVKKEAETTKTKLEVFTSKTGSITKFTDFNTSGLKVSGIQTPLETLIRKVNSGILVAYFYQIKRNVTNSTASIEYTDIIEILKAIKTLKLEYDKDISLKPDYLENKFTTSDGFLIGYYADNSKNSWFIKLDKYNYKDETLSFDNVETLETAFNEAKLKIEDLKK
ncbi:hypothetical protein SAMN05660845_2511 [Flavobacterium swingsii]|uniref:Uncharacterized protein n=1 Tax=Flavobacterium swingsii TaxID=498292 RepID=A0A1I0ZWR8_9FLAO|nr:hypothetical protein [Flavobacterium swingsii]SFB30031.1 hypothetical protein SAMN05660845_2511 [Flavobacterium swingsii]